MFIRKSSLPTLDRYLLRQLVPPFTIALGTMLVALLLDRLLALFNRLASSGSSIATLLTLLSDLLPHYMGLALPAALCIAVFMTINRMSEHNEIDVLYAGHISLLRISQPYIKVGAVLAVLSVLLYGYLQPIARYDYREGFYFARHTGWAPHLQSDMFATTSTTTLLTADYVDHGGSRLRRIFIRDVKDDGTTELITAPKGLLTLSERDKSTQLDLWNGQIIRAKSPNLPDSHVSVTHFEHIARLIERSGNQEAFRSRGNDEREMTTLEILSAIRHNSSHISPKTLRAEIDFRLARAISIMFIPFLSIAFAVRKKRKRSALGQIMLAIILVGFDEVLLFGDSLAANGTAPVWLSLWVPEAIFCLGCTFALLARSKVSWRHREQKSSRTA
ncbi:MULTISPECIES: LptF/LptG family permease [Bombella]|uniref:LptF/LptG family permease n=1 Tax=Bombella pollinis TaxID=2967337 RepID=A0ABT3WQW5_9PROT|nr:MULTISPECIES: LptF/LptG family permease [Bombella]MCX5619226.1 LptF/LptG family permease [Bombella pollinis]MUG04700.1 LptF/LptG family permease [Bombella sp. ESL0378]MUG90242.1 LptF/LptG family permease [Bombella sp. ESL0385]